MKSEKEDSEKSCAGYLREPHNAPPVLFLQYPDGTKQGLCRVCATRFLLSDDEFPPKEEKTAKDTSTSKQAQIP
jgi:hypothetical protein